ncbi:MAG: hypothetical protein LE178_01705, partial [Endomicrobium sp.]|nr:hypothetical protein [Endomicrobium sp.]
ISHSSPQAPTPSHPSSHPSASALSASSSPSSSTSPTQSSPPTVWVTWKMRATRKPIEQKLKDVMMDVKGLALEAMSEKWDAENKERIRLVDEELDEQYG